MEDDQLDEPGRDFGAWADPVDYLEVRGIDPAALNLNVAGRKLAGAMQGFGKLWRKRYWVPIGGDDVTPEEVIAVWKREYSSFWPDNARLFAPLADLHPGDVALINSTEGGIELSTGVMVMYVDDTSFAFMTAEGHPFAGWITFSATRDADGGTVASADMLLRPGDPLYDVAFSLFASRREDQVWRQTLGALARRFESDGDVEMSAECLDRRRQWRRFGNIRRNAALRSGWHTVVHPIRTRRRRRTHSSRNGGR